MIKKIILITIFVFMNNSYANVVKDDLKLLEKSFSEYDFSKNTKVTDTERCLAETSYFEASGLKTMTDKFLSAIAALNRARSDSPYFANTVCGVVAQKAQFPWYKAPKRHKAKNHAAWQTALAISKVLQAHKDQIHSRITFFHTKKIHPRWATKMKVAYIGEAHLFY
jgi:spore germination cell wall hydrolase CwlJ-like protein